MVTVSSWSHRLYKTKAKYLERKPLIGRILNGSDMRHFSRSDLYSEQQQRDTVKSSDGTKSLHGMLEFPRVLPTKAPNAPFLSPAARSISNLDTDCRTQALVVPYSSTPRHLSGKRSPHASARMPVLPRSIGSLQHLEDTGFEPQELKRSKSISATRACPSYETSVPWYQLSLTDHEESPQLCMQKPARSCSVVEQMRKMSSFQADYWACAIPDSLPPSPDRQSPLWNPNKEYEDLLDYTYPLRPKYKLAKNLKDSTVHDSGIDLDSLSISPESTLKSMSMWDQEHQTMESPSAQRLSSPFLKKLECSAPVSQYRISPFGKLSLADGGPSAGGIAISGVMSPSLSPGCPEPPNSTFVIEQGRNKKRHDCLLRRKAASGNFLCSTSTLPLQKECASDDEYLSLPPRLKELETLAQQLTDLTLTIKKPEHGQVQDDSPCISVNGERLLSEVQGDSDGNESQWELYCDSLHTCSFQEPDEIDILRDRNNKDHESEPRETASPDFLEMRCPEFLCVKQKKDHYSLAQCIKIFCYQLEELIRWLHKVAEVIDHWIPPKPDIESVKASYQNYLEFKKDLAGHQELTEGVLHDGEKLLKCMSSNSPAAVHTLDAGLKKHCDAQETAVHTETSE
ncbi:centrosomal protein of 68 kDa isoform X2 [Python bivittatus]|uniref:Centrosomal protein of 68 kDa isoform X2 n=1 Tax=Python bivittatus TaxID=176946 RepID=A0A9F2QXI5_PYTBI|nr:centrosomal protein of 68 kDa isoform X2 [Python bivittatus]